MLLLLIGGVAAAGTLKHATPEDYRRVLTTLQAGDTLVLAAGQLMNPDLSSDAPDFSPRPGHCEGPLLDSAAFAQETAFDMDFNGAPRGGCRLRGAYATAGPNRGWRLQRSVKP